MLDGAVARGEPEAMIRRTMCVKSKETYGGEYPTCIAQSARGHFIPPRPSLLSNRGQKAENGSLSASLLEESNPTRVPWVNNEVTSASREQEPRRSLTWVAEENRYNGCGFGKYLAHGR